MSPIIRAKCFSLLDIILCFSDLAVVLYSEVLRLGSDYERIDLVFDCYFNWTLKEVTRISKGIGARFQITELPEIPKYFENLLHINQNRCDVNEYLPKKLIMMHHENQILVCMYRETLLSLHQEEIENNTDITITSC